MPHPKSAKAINIATNKDSIEEIPFATVKNIPDHGAFIAIFCKNILPYAFYPEACEEQKHFQTNAMLMIFRWDQKTGFVGGKVNTGESLENAAVREAQEEANVGIEKQRLQPVCSHRFQTSRGSDFASHLFAVETTPTEFLEIWKNSVADPEKIIAENRGIKVVTTEFAETSIGLAATLAGQLPPSVMEEILILVEKFNLVTADHLSHLKEIAAWKADLPAMPLPPNKSPAASDTPQIAQKLHL